jgi:ribosomal-protein-alanine N-acetyltransferase
MELHTERLHIREFEPTDEADIHEYASDPEVCRFMEWGPNTHEETRTFLARKLERMKNEPRTEFELAVVLMAERKVIGGVGIRIKSTKHREGDIGYVLGRRYWNRGIVTEASRAVLDYGFTQLKLHRIYATCDAENRGSARVMEKLGMRYEGRKRENAFEKGRWRDTVMYAILEDDPRP